MLKVKVFDESYEKDLEKELNNLILELDKNDQEIIDIKYSTSCSCDGTNEFYIYSALVMYEDKQVKEYKPKKIENLRIECENERTGNSYIKNEHGTKCYLTKHSKIIASKLNEVIDLVNKSIEYNMQLVDLKERTKHWWNFYLNEKAINELEFIDINNKEE